MSSLTVYAIHTLQVDEGHVDMHLKLSEESRAKSNIYCKKVRHEQGFEKDRPKFCFKHPWIVGICPQNEFGDFFLNKIFFGPVHV